MIEIGKIKVVEGWITRQYPRPASEGAGEVRRLPVGTLVPVSDITLYNGVPYCRIINPKGSDEYGRLGEAGYLRLDDNADGSKTIVLNKSIRHYAEPAFTIIPAPENIPTPASETIEMTATFNGRFYKGTLKPQP